MTPIIETNRLSLRRIERTDAQGIFEAYAQDPEVTTYMSWAPHQSLEDTFQFLDLVLQHWEEKTEFTYIILPKGQSQLIGCMGASIKGCRAHCGYVLARQAWGNGYTTEAFRALIPELFGLEEVKRIEAICDLQNIASARVMEKAGLEHEGILKSFLNIPAFEEARDVHMYGLAKKSWQTLIQ
ncbi:MAG: GNAT family protein [Bacteroidota bacterium]